MKIKKFRIWDAKARQFIYPGGISIINKSWEEKEIEEDPFGIGPITDLPCFYNDDEYLQQYIGILDSQGNPIYEGDICKISFVRVGTQICYIKYDDKELQYSFYMNETEGFPVIIKGDYSSIVVIGSIFEHKTFTQE